MTGKVKRSEFATFIDVDPGYEDWALLGEGVTSGEINYNPETSEEVFIHEDSGETDVESYKPSMPIEAIAYDGDEVFEYIDALRKARAVLDDCHTQVVNVWKYEEAVAGAYPAELQDVAIAIENFGGAGGESTKINFTIHYRGDPVVGTFNPSTLTWTAS